MDPDERTQLQSLIAAEAWGDARRVLSKHPRPDDPAWLAHRAEIETGEGNLEAAAATFDRILEEWPHDATALYNASVVYSDLDRHEDAMFALEGLVEAEGESPSVLNDLAYEYIEAGHNVPAALAAARAEQLSVDEAQRCRARLNTATALANMGRNADARRCVDAMLRDCTGTCGEREAAEELRADLKTSDAPPSTSARTR